MAGAEALLEFHTPEGEGINPANFQHNHMGFEIWSKQALKMAEMWFFTFGGIWGASG